MNNSHHFRLRRELKETKMQRWYLFWRSHFDDKKYDEDKLNLINFYHNEGYRDAEIVSDSIYYDESNKAMTILISINEGPQYRYRKFTWEGHSLYTEGELSRALDLEIGEKYNEEDFNIAVYERMHGLYMDRGYIYSNIIPKFTPVVKIHWIFILKLQKIIKCLFAIFMSKATIRRGKM
jgi:outer membrane protein insertion porin family